jgi:hypothetical protein
MLFSERFASNQFPTPEALADLVARCAQINRFTTQLTAVEENRIAALASGLLVMRGVLALPQIRPDKLPMRQSRIDHWALTAHHLADVATPAIKRVHGMLVLDEHEQVKILAHRNWKGVWRDVTLWRDGVQGLSAHDLMQYLAALTVAAQERAPDAARELELRSNAVAGAERLASVKPRMR